MPQAMGETISLWLPPHLPSAGAPRALNSGWVSTPTGPFPFMGITGCSKNQNKDATAGMVTQGPPQHLQQEPQRAPTALREGAAPPQSQFKRFLRRAVSPSQQNQTFAGGAARSLAQHRRQLGLDPLLPAFIWGTIHSSLKHNSLSS